MPLTDMALTPAEAKEENSCLVCSDEIDHGPKYPYGLSLNLDAVSMEKLGIAELPKIGEVLHLTAVVQVNSTSQYENQGGSEKSLNMQITQMDLGAPAQDAATTLYGNDA